MNQDAEKLLAHPDTAGGADAVGWTAALLAAATGCILLWFPSAAVGVGIFEAAGQNTYLTLRGLAPYAAASLVLMVVPIAMASFAAGRITRHRAWVTAGGLFVLWQFAWVLITLVSGNPELIAWPSYAAPAEAEPWNPAAVFATGLAIVGVVVGMLARVLAGPSTLPVRGAPDSD